MNINLKSNDNSLQKSINHMWELIINLVIQLALLEELDDLN
jgi:hypothetical protein